MIHKDQLDMFEHLYAKPARRKYRLRKFKNWA